MTADVVWEQTMDSGLWRARVVRTAPYRGKLLVTNNVSQEVIYQANVDIEKDRANPLDIAEWRDRSLSAVYRFLSGAIRWDEGREDDGPNTGS